MIWFYAYLMMAMGMNVLSFLLFAFDKFLAKRQASFRIPEATLLSGICFGGAIGGLIGMYLLRHKTHFASKFHFALTVWLSLVIQIAGAFWLGRGISIPFQD